MKIHPTVGGDILKRVNFPYPVEDIVRYHHEKWTAVVIRKAFALSKSHWWRASFRSSTSMTPLAAIARTAKE